jgi:hypothetical protein
MKISFYFLTRFSKALLKKPYLHQMKDSKYIKMLYGILHFAPTSSQF